MKKVSPGISVFILLDGYVEITLTWFFYNTKIDRVLILVQMKKNDQSIISKVLTLLFSLYIKR